MIKTKGFLYLIGISLILFVSGCGDSTVEKVDNAKAETTDNTEGDQQEENATNQSETNNSEEDSAEEDLGVGDSVSFNDVIITLNDARIEPGGDFDEPENEQFVVVNLTAENKSDEEANVSSMMNVELYDEEGYSYSTTILMEGTKGQFDGSIPTGKKLRGEIPFDVPASETYELHFSDPFQSGKAIWTIDAGDLE